MFRQHLFWWSFVSGALIIGSGVDRAFSARASDTTGWLTSYGLAMEQAKHQQRMLFLYFFAEQTGDTTRIFDEVAAYNPEIRAKLNSYVLAKLPVGATITVGGESIRLLDHGAFVEMNHRSGVAIIDLTDPQSEHYHHVVSVYPFSSQRVLDRRRLAALLDLPRGGLTQRTLIFAVRTHPEGPQSAAGAFDPVLADETKRHSTHQASIGVQGHHDFTSRANRIQARMARGSMVQEVCAESWPGQGLFDAAHECVESWRSSSGHWSAVRSRHSFFGFDMKRGLNGVWYATGIFVP